MTSLVILGLAALLAGAALLWLVEASISRTTVGVALILSGVVAESAKVPLPTLQAGGVVLYPGDVVFAVIATACVARVLRARRLRPAHYWLLALAALTAYSLLRGVAAYGPAAVSESRSWLLPVAAMVYIATATPSAGILDRIGRLWVWSGSALALVAVGRWASLATGAGLGPIFAPNVAGDIRVLGAPETLIIAQAFVILAPSWDRRGATRDRIWAALLLGTVLLMLHRTVWIAVLGAILAFFWRRPSLGRRFGVGLVVIGAVATLAATMLLSADPNNLESRAANTDTFAWRLEGWQQLLLEQEPEDQLSRLVGERFGSGFTRMVNGVVRDESPHSTYIEALLRMGILGALALLGPALAATFVLAQRRRTRSMHLLENDSLLSLTVFSLLYGIAYGPQVTTIMALGLAVNVALCAHAPAATSKAGHSAAPSPSAIPGMEQSSAAGGTRSSPGQTPTGGRVRPG